MVSILRSDTADTNTQSKLPTSSSRRSQSINDGLDAGRVVRMGTQALTAGGALGLQRIVGNRATVAVMARSLQRQRKEMVVQRLDVNFQPSQGPSQVITVGGPPRGMPSWVQAGETWHLNLSSSDTSHITKEGIPKVHYYFAGTGVDIKDKTASRGEQGKAKKKKKDETGKVAKVQTKLVFSKLPSNVQLFVRTHFADICRATD